jgi:DNA ligase-1
MSDLIESTPQGLYCSAGGFWIDPWQGVPRAVVTHAHTDHARWGCERYLTSPTGRIVLAARLGPGAASAIDAIPYRQGVRIGDVRVSLHPAGHVLGSAQVRVERLAGPRAGEVWVVSGDYKLDRDGVSEPFEPVRCDTFITESTFGLPVYTWPDPALVMSQINAWWAACAVGGRLPILACYALGKAQRLLAGLDRSIGPILIHGALRACTDAYASAGVAMPPVQSATHHHVREAGGRAIVLAPPSAVRSAWAYKLPGPEHELASAMASGWMTVRGGRRRQALDTGFALSDHADWPGLHAAIKATGASRVGVTHGSIGPMVRFLSERGLDAFAVQTRFMGEQEVPADDDQPATGPERRDEASPTPDGSLPHWSSIAAASVVATEPAAPLGDQALIDLHRDRPRPGVLGSAEQPERPGGFARFARLFLALDATTKTTDKLDLLAAYFAQARDLGASQPRVLDDAAWAVALFSGRRVKRAVTRGQLQAWAVEASGVPDWLLAECLAVVGDLGETLALVLDHGPAPAPSDQNLSLADACERLAAMVRQGEQPRRAQVHALWAGLDRAGRLVFHKLISASFRLGVSRLTIVRALASVAGIATPQMDQRLMGDWPVTGSFFASLLATDAPPGHRQTTLSPFPFFLAHQLPDELDRPDLLQEALGHVTRWQAEWKWDGIRAQLIRDGARAAIWSRGEEPLAEQFPELIDAAMGLPPGLTLDGEILAFDRDLPLDFSHLQTRINKRVRDALLFHDVPVVFMAYDLLRLDGSDLRPRPLTQRRDLLEALLASTQSTHTLLRLSERVPAESWGQLEQARAQSRSRGVEGLMLKRTDSPYGTGRTKLSLVDDKAAGAWWKWKVDPYTIDCVLVAAQRGSGRRASLFTDYTFAVWDGPAPGTGELVPFAKAYHGKGMTDETFVEIDAFVRAHTTGRIPSAGIRSVEPSLVFELAFEGLQHSPRHKSGLAVRFPRINRWRRDKPANQADTLETVKALLASHQARVRSGGPA